MTYGHRNVAAEANLRIGQVIYRKLSYLHGSAQARPSKLPKYRSAHADFGMDRGRAAPELSLERIPNVSKSGLLNRVRSRWADPPILILGSSSLAC